MNRTQKALVNSIRRATRAEDFQKAWAILEDHWDQVLDSKRVASAWLDLLDADPEAKIDREAIETALVRWEDDPRLVLDLCHQLLNLVDGRPMDEPVPEDDPAQVVISYLKAAIEALDARVLQNPNGGGLFWNALGTAFRLAGREHDQEALDAYSHALATENRLAWRFNMGLLLKNRQRWEEGTQLFKELFEEDSTDPPILWNLGICATARGDAELACRAWQAAGFPAVMGEDGRPRIERLGQVKVRVPGYPEDAEGVVCFEHLWVQPLSPCHGRVLNPMLYSSPVEVHDLVLWDGQPIGYAQVDGVQVPRFAMLERLQGGGWQSFRFRAEQAEAGQISELSNFLPHESSLYIFEEQVAFVCMQCIRTGGPHSEEHERDPPDESRVSGKILVCPQTPLPLLRVKLEGAVAEARIPGFAVPDLYEALGEDEALEAHRKNWAEL